MCVLDKSLVADLVIECLKVVMQMDVQQQVCFEIPKVIQARSITATIQEKINVTQTERTQRKISALLRIDQKQMHIHAFISLNTNKELENVNALQLKRKGIQTKAWSNAN